MNALEEFTKHSNSASYHYADDSGKEWNLADTAKRKALEIFDANPELHDEIRKVVSLWSLNMARPIGDK